MSEQDNLQTISKNDEVLASKIYIIREQKVMLDRDLAELYGTETKALNQAVKRNIDKFPSDFRFQLTSDEKDELVTKCDRFESLKHTSINPHAFTEHGVLMLANVLKSKIATQMSIRLIFEYIDRLHEKIEDSPSLPERKQIGYVIGGKK